MTQKGTKVTVNAGRWTDAPGTVVRRDGDFVVVELDSGTVVAVEFSEVALAE